MASSKQNQKPGSTGTRKERNVNFNQDETTKLKCLLKDFPLLTSKNTDCASNQQKDVAWRSLAEKFNSNATIYRTIKHLQQKFNNMKKIARKEMSAERSGRRQTGGGPPPPRPSDTTEWLNSIMGESISGLPAVYDSDALSNTTMDLNNSTATAGIVLDLLESNKLFVECKSPSYESVDKSTTKLSMQCSNNTQPGTQCIDVSQNIETDVETKECDIVFDSSTPKALLRKPISKQLSSCFNKKKGAFTPLETRKRLITHFENKEGYLSHKKSRDEEIKKLALEEHTQNLMQKKEMHDKTLELMQEKHMRDLQNQKELHDMEVEFKKQFYKLTLENLKLENEKLNEK